MDAHEHGTLYQSLQRTVARFGHRPAYMVPPMHARPFHPDGREYTWDQTWAEVQARKQHYADAGYGPGHRVAILFDQRPEFIFHHFALNALGCSTVPISPDYLRDEIAFLLEHSEACLALAINPRLADVAAAAGTLSIPIPVLPFDDLNTALPQPPRPAATLIPDGATEAALLYTSGTTGRPKGCIMSNEYFHTFGGSLLSRGGRLAMQEGVERLYNPLPLHHANCLSISLPAMLLAGGCLAFPDRFHAGTFWRDIVACRITAVQFQGVIPNILLKLPPCVEERAHAVKFALCAGVEPSQHAAFEERFGFPLVEMWAMSETGRLMSDHIEPRQIHTRAIGRAMPGLEARVVDDEDRDMPVGQPGELVVRHSAEAPRKGFFSGYLKNEAATEDAWRNGWFHTGDAVIRDASGMFFFTDRKKNIIRRSGENIAAAEVEACLVAHEKVQQVAVLAVPDELREEEVMACIVANPPDDAGEAFARELTAWCRTRLAYFKAPGWYLFVDRLPTGSSQKFQKAKLFPPDVDPRAQAGAIDLRDLKKPARSPSSSVGREAGRGPGSELDHARSTNGYIVSSETIIPQAG
jgi:acyl-CoA synthetase (AMP-forming)/AMP-acid ligase II